MISKPGSQRNNVFEKIFFLCILALLTIFCAGCEEKKNPQKAEATPQTTKTAMKPLEDLVVESKVVTPHQVDLTWNKISRATGYDVFRRSLYDRHHHNDDEVFLTHLTSDETSYQDTTAKKGCYYTYLVRAHRSFHLPDITAHTKEDMPAILRIAEAHVFTGVPSPCWGLRGSSDVLETCPDHITLPIQIDQCGYGATGVTTTGIEISRGTSLYNISKWEDVPITKDDIKKIDKEPTFLYQDKRVEAGQTYYYQVRGYAETGSKRFYGEKGEHLKISAVLPDGDFAMDLTEKKGKNPAFEISLHSTIAGNARLEFLRNEWNGLVDYVYQKKDSSYHSVSMRLESYKKTWEPLSHDGTMTDGTQPNLEKTQSWTPYDAQELYLDRQESIGLRLVPLEGEEMTWPETGTKSAEIILRANYNGAEVFLYFDIKEKRVFLRQIESETDPLHSIYETIPKVDIHKYNAVRKRKKIAKLYSSDSVLFYGGLSFHYRGKTRNCPDGVEIYRSEDKKNFSFLDTVKYLDYGGEHHKTAYEDPSIQPGRTYYYKVRNYIDTDTGRIYGEFTPPQVFHAQYYTGKYKIWLVDDEKKQKKKQFIVGIHSCSRGNPSLYFGRYRYSGSCQTYKKKIKDWEKGHFNLLTKAYSMDGIHWKKWKRTLKGNVLPPKGTIYLKLVLGKKQLKTKKFDRNRITRISVGGDVEDKDPWLLSSLTLTKELESGKLSEIFLSTFLNG